ncbi:MAG: SRPBCC domain-containing protein [Spirochaetales bacterium]|nr:SRPBCC domain-containing protein [Spirochaetales bacterium]
MTTIDPILKTVRVSLSPSDACALFTERIASWWPLETHSVGGDRARTVVFESGIGGRIYEVLDDGTESDWGRVTAWEPPARITFTWHPGRPIDTAGEVTVEFVAEGHETVVTLIHKGWEKLGERASEIRSGYDTGWDLVFGKRFAALADSR